MVWITNLNAPLNIKSQMCKNQIEECAFYILDDYHYLKMVDFKLFFSDIKKGEYGQIYESLSISKILGWLKKYVINRSNLFEKQDDNEANQIRQTILIN